MIMRKILFIGLAFLLILGIHLPMANAAPTMVFDIDFWTDGTNANHNYVKGDYNTGEMIFLDPCETVWIDLYVSGFDETGNGLAGYGFEVPFDPANLEVAGPSVASSIPIYPWVDLGQSQILPDRIQVGAGHFPPGTGAEGDDIVLASWAFHCVGPSIDELLVLDFNPAPFTDWLTLLGDELDAQLADGVYLGTIVNTPIPGAVWLLASGFVVLVGIRRRSKNC
jgi:hypothetical protein